MTLLNVIAANCSVPDCFGLVAAQAFVTDSLLLNCAFQNDSLSLLLCLHLAGE